MPHVTTFMEKTHYCKLSKHHCSYFYTGTVSWDRMKRDICGMLVAVDELQLMDLIDYLQKELISKHKDYVMDHLVELFQTPRA